MSDQAAVICNGPWMNSEFVDSASDNWSNGFNGADVNADYYKSDYDATNNTSEQSQEQDDRRIAALNQVKNEMCAGKVVFTYPIWKGQLSFGGIII
jgi:hypothetical protein